MEGFYFLNLQYWYCIVYSLFGGDCAYLDQLRAEGVDVPFDGVGTNGAEVEPQGVFGILQGSLEGFAEASSVVLDPIVSVFSFIWSTYSVLAWSVSGFLFFAILSAIAGLLYVRFRELSTYSTLPPEVKRDDPRHNRWEELLEHAKSTDPKLWRQSILEADHMLGELLESLGYKGATTAEKMRNLPEDAFVTMPAAWEAHRIRNFVSQGASDFILTQREAFRVMKLYEQVFEEFNFV